MTSTRLPVDDVRPIRELDPPLGFAGPVRIVAPRPPDADAQAVATRLGFDVTTLQRDGEARRAALRARADEQVAASVAASGERATRLSAELAALAAGPARLSGVDGPPSDGFFNVSTPTRIFTTGGLQLGATSLVPFNSSAKVIRPNSDASGIQEVLFAFPWVNTTTVDQVITVTGVVGVNGQIGANDDGGFTVFGHDASILTVQTILRVFADGDDSQEFTGTIAGGSQIASLTAFMGGWPTSVGAILVQSLVRGTALQAVDQLVKAGATRMFHLGVQFDNRPTDGSTNFDFSTGAQEVSGFALFVRVTS